MQEEVLLFSDTHYYLSYMKDAINFIRFQPFQMLVCIFDFLIPRQFVVNERALGLYPFSEGPHYFIIAASFLSYLFL